MVMTIKWDADAQMHYMMCGAKRQYVRVEDADGNILVDGRQVDNGSDTGASPADGARKDEREQ